MTVLQAALPMSALDDPDPDNDDRSEVVRKAARLIARMPSLVAAWHRICNGLDVPPPDDDLDHAGNFLWMLNGEKPDLDTAHDLDVILILHADHTFNASTFACREVISTKANIYAGVTAGLGALSGSLHGGANARVMKMLMSLEKEKDVAGWVKQRLDAGEKVMGLGHAVYKTLDPRARYLKDMADRLGQKSGAAWTDLANQVAEIAMAEFAARGKTGINPNVDFYAAPVYYMMGIPIDLMTPMFAVSRVSGWSAHAIEEYYGEAQGKPALYRPKAEYVGEYCGLMGCEYPGAKG